MVWTEEAKAKLYEDYRGKVLGYLHSRINNSEQAEDLCSDVFLKVYSSLDSYDESKAGLSTWIFHITNNTLTDFFRKNRPTDELDENLADSQFSLDDSLVSNEALEALANGLEHLSSVQRDLIICRYYKEMTLLEAAERVGISYTYAKVQHKKAMDTLQKFLKDY